MKIQYIIKLLSRLCLAGLLTINIISAAELAHDDFNSGSLDGWSGSGVSSNSGWLQINRDKTASKTYNLGLSNADKSVTIKLRVDAVGSWDESGSYQDYFNILVNGSNVKTYSPSEGIYIYSLTSTLDSSGKITLDLNPNTTANSEYAKIDYVIIDDTVDPTVYTTGFHDFDLINPPSTRNILGNYAIAGNTVMCLTEKTTGYGGTCHGQTDYELITSNMHVSKYIDIDSDARTWDSSSSYIDLPTSYKSNNGKGILWAGLFWQGRFSKDTNYPMHYGMENGASYTLTEMGQGSGYGTIDVSTLEANKIKLKVDTGNYNDATASNVYTYSSSNGTTYAAYADVTQILQNANLNTGKHTFTVANLTTNEGREPSPGVFGGWSLVVIYAEDFTGDLRNVSIYNGFVSLGTNNDPISISGFKLPKDGDVSAQLSVFSGEGEYRYGRRPGSDKSDWMKISNDETTGYQYLPGATHPNNMFDAVLDGVLRDDIAGESNNLQVNNDGVDIDRFDVSPLMEGYRDANINTNEVFIKVYSDNDYVTPSMIAFSTQLYRPKLCYDYSVRKDGFTLDAENRDIVTVGNGEIALNASIKSMEGDFDLENSRMKVRFTPSEKVSFTGAKYSPNTVNTLIPAIHTATSTSQEPEIAIGANATSNGGTIGRFERYFSEFKYDMTSDRLNGHFEVDLNVTLDFGSGPIYNLISSENNSLPRCDQNLTYNPQWGMFNVERTDSATYDPVAHPEQRFPLYTQVTGRDFDFSVVAYDANATPPYSRELTLSTDLTVDVELIDASPYDDTGSFFTCENTDQSIIQTLSGGVKSFFVKVPAGSSRVDLNANNDIITDTALRNAAFRMWLLVDANKTIIPHHCNNRNDNACFETVYNTYLKAGDTNNYCSSCSSYTGGCYQCLHDHFAIPICSRDNFSIKPASYRTVISDVNESNRSTDPVLFLGKNNTVTPLTLSAGYQYRIEGNATQFNSDKFARGYNRDFYTPSNNDLMSQLQFNTAGTCADTNNTDWGVHFENGQIIATIDGTEIQLYSNNLHKHSNVGNYNYHIEDNNWTIVDQQRFPFKTFPDVDDCLPNNASISNNGNQKSGCGISSTLAGTSLTYIDMPLRFEPYDFNITNERVSSRANPNNNTYIYISDLNGSLNMAAQLDSNITAMSKDGKVTTNFTTTCAAEDLVLKVDRSMIPNENNITSFLGAKTVFQQRLYSTADTNFSIADDNMTFSKTNFTNDPTNNGSANARILFNFQRPTYSDRINPIDVNFTALHARSPNATSNTHMIPNYIPDENGTGVINAKRYFYYAKVAPVSPFHNTMQISYTDRMTNILRVSVYCTDPVDSNVTCANMGLNTAFIDESNALDTWYRMTSHSSANGEGQVIKLTVNPSSIGLSPSANIALDNNGSSVGIVASYPLAAPRRKDGTVTILADPWLMYKPDFIISFRNEGFRWKGEGRTGHVIDANASRDTNSKRLNW